MANRAEIHNLTQDNLQAADAQVNHPALPNVFHQCRGNELVRKRIPTDVQHEPATLEVIQGNQKVFNWQGEVPRFPTGYAEFSRPTPPREGGEYNMNGADVGPDDSASARPE